MSEREPESSSRPIAMTPRPTTSRGLGAHLTARRATALVEAERLNASRRSEVRRAVRGAGLNDFMDVFVYAKKKGIAWRPPYDVLSVLRATGLTQEAFVSELREMKPPRPPTPPKGVSPRKPKTPRR
jgi:hypothetical protein